MRQNEDSELPEACYNQKATHCHWLAVWPQIAGPDLANKIHPLVIGKNKSDSILDLLYCLGLLMLVLHLLLKKKMFPIA